jgi:predicted amidohydrolase YtcJ
VLIRCAEVEGRIRDVRIAQGRIQAIAGRIAPDAGEGTIDAQGGALLPGLHDHHIHLLSLAATLGSVACGPPSVLDRSALASALSSATGDFLRGVGYHESVAGPLDRVELDALVPERPARIQHRSGALWMLNSRAIDLLRLDQGTDASGVERDVAGRATGRLFRLDRWLREQLRSDAAPDLAPVGKLLARAGITGVTDATADTDSHALALLEAAVASGALPQRLAVMGCPELPPAAHPDVVRVQVKLVLDESALPSFEAFCTAIVRAHAQERGVAIHCVGRAELVLAARALAEAGLHADDRLEHASVAPPELVALVAKTGALVVTQPHFLEERGDDYLREVEANDLPWLYRGRAWLDAGVRLAGGSDAPFGTPDPWLAIRAAVSRRTRAGATLGEGERLTPERALGLFLGPLRDPGGPPRRVVLGAPADLCLLDRPWRDAREELSIERVRATWRAGRLLWPESTEGVSSRFLAPFHVRSGDRLGSARRGQRGAQAESGGPDGQV